MHFEEILEKLLALQIISMETKQLTTSSKTGPSITLQNIEQCKQTHHNFFASLNLAPTKLILFRK